MKALFPMFYLSSIVFANWLVAKYGIIDLGIIKTPAGVFLIGITFTLRDFVQREWGDIHVWFWMLLATAITTLMNWHIALASCSAFLVSETLDWIVYKFAGMDLKKRIIISNAFSIPIDSCVFIWIAFGFNLEVIIGQSIIKYLFGLAGLLFLFMKRYQKVEA